MKTFFIWILAGLCICMNISAQGYGGRGGFGGGRGGYGGNRGDRYGSTGMRSQSQSNMANYDQVSITDFPEIAGLTLKQKLELSTLVTDEHKNLLKLTDQKEEIRVKIDHAANQKEVDKYKKKMAKLDEKCQKVSLKTDKKIQSILTNDQYREFIEKKHLIKFDILPNYRNLFHPNPNQQENNNNPERREEGGFYR